MSLTSDEDRPILKAKRFNKFNPSSSTPKIKLTEKDFSYKHGTKRTTNDDNRNVPAKQRKTCRSPSPIHVPSSSTRNLANNRLKKLRENLKADLKYRAEVGDSQITNASTSVSKKKQLNEKCRYLAKPLNNEINNRSLENDDDKLLQRKPIIASSVLSEEKTSSSLTLAGDQAFKKNFANERLHKIKKRFSDPVRCPSTYISKESTTKEINISDNKLTAGIKRNIDNVTNTNNSTLSSTESSLNTFKRFAITQTEPLTSDRDFVFKHNSYTYHTGITPVSQKQNLLSNNFEKNLNAPKDINSSTPISQKLSKTRTDFDYDDNKPNLLKQPTVQGLSASYLEEKPHPSPLLVSKSDSFLSKMAMTASWINNHKDLNNTVNNLLIPSQSSVNIIEATNLNNNNFAQETEDMEWTNAEPDDEIQDSEKPTEVNGTETGSVLKDPEKLKDLCIVVDTNVFISGISKIRDVVNLKTGLFKPLIYIPWMVITELDYMKDSCADSKLKKNVTNSIKYINSNLKEKNPRFQGQTILEMEKQKYVGLSPDDKVISCCLQVSEKYETVILLSNDVNLRNKAMINGLSTCSSNEIMMRIMLKLGKSNKYQKILHKMGILCSSVICECVKAAYGNVWMKMDMLNNPPWSLVECLKRLKKYWSSVFREKLMKHFTKTMENLLNLLELNSYICEDSEEFVEFMKLCVTLCIFLKDIEECRGFVESTLKDITKLAE